MRKIQKTVINANYQKISSKSIVINALIPFDCYIKRFNAYVIIIKAGTLITKNLFEKLSLKDLYIQNIDREIFEAYKHNHSYQNEEVKEIVAISGAALEIKEKISELYRGLGNYLDHYFLDKSVTLELEIIESYIESFLILIFNNKYQFEDFSVTLDSVYCEAHHCVNVCLFSALFAKANGFEYEIVHKIALAGLFHDIGKRYITKSLLDKRSSLNEEEFDQVKKHSKYSVKAAKEIGISDTTILLAIAQHHEKLDGSGYPFGMMLDKISVEAQIIAICDTFDALTTERTYRKKYTSFDALHLMQDTMPRQLNIKFIKRFIKMFIS